MFVLVTGGSGSGKSAYAESRILEFGLGERIYLATMMCFDEESKKRVERHRKMREGKGFETAERFLDLKNWEPGSRKKEGQRTILLECMSNLAANEMFDPAGSGADTAEEIKKGIEGLLAKCDHLVVVTNEVFSDGISYEKETEAYLKALGEINCYMARRADQVVEVVYGIPVMLKPARSKENRGDR